MSEVTIVIHTPEEVLPIRAQTGQTILSALPADQAGRLHTPCGGKGTCQKCVVHLTPDGKESVLACQTRITSDMEIWLDGDTGMRFAEADASLTENADAGLALAFDIGTTTVAAFLLADGIRLGAASELNVNKPYGGDVITRIESIRTHGLDALTNDLRGQLARMARSLCAQAGLDPADVRRWVVAGNTVMQHIADGLSPESIAAAPFTPLSLFGDSRQAARWGFSLPGEIYIAPAVAGYVGGDITAGLLACGMLDRKEPCLLLDIGTNGEMALWLGDTFLTCAAAAGPAFEGAGISDGMPAMTGAVDCVKPDFSFTTIGGAAPRGLCGSGLLDLTACLLRSGEIDETGRLETAFILSEGVGLTPRDVRQVQLAKAAIAAGIEVLLAEAGLSARDVADTYLAGGFGSRLSAESAREIGLIPQALRVTSVGNAAGRGAMMAAARRGHAQTLREIAGRCRYWELSGSAAFQNAYIEHMILGRVD